MNASAIHVELDQILQRAFTAFHAGFEGVIWRGKERDYVNRFVMGYLVPECSPGRLLGHPTQLGIEVPVKQPSGIGEKRTAPKDLVIWPQPFMSCWSGDWDPVHAPLAVVEWKAQRPAASKPDPQGDRKWLQAFTAENPTSLGYAVFLDFTRVGSNCIGPVRLTVSRCHSGEWQDAWIKLSS